MTDATTIDRESNAIETDPLVLYLGTNDGLRTYRWSADGLEPVAHGIHGNAVRDVAVHPDDADDAFVACGLRGWGLHHTTDAGRSTGIVGFEDRWVWGVERDPTDPERIYVGTEPPALFVSNDEGVTFESFEDLETLPSRSSWTFFHDPFRAGHVHGIAIHPDRPERLFAGVEHGALVYSHDGGESWNGALVGRDIHRVAIDPDEPDRVFAATGSGLARSTDAGETWTAVDDLRGVYTHAIVFDSARPKRAYAYADREGDPLVRSDDGGETWVAIGAGLPAAGPADTIRPVPGTNETIVYAGDERERETSAGGEARTGTSRLYVSTDAGETWRRSTDAFPRIWRLEVAAVA